MQNLSMNQRRRVKSLSQVRIALTYFVAETATDQKLRELGFVKGQKVILTSLTDANAIVSIGGTRLALDRGSLTSILVTEEYEDELRVSLATLEPNETGIVRRIDAQPATKRRLMDMGITRGVSIFVRKLAPLGDPMELHLRGYALSLRKADAAMIQVVKEEK